MSIPLTLGISMSAALIGTVLRKYYTDRTAPSTSAVFLFNGVGSLVAALIPLLWGGISTISPFTWILGCVFGVMYFLKTRHSHR